MTAPNRLRFLIIDKNKKTRQRQSPLRESIVDVMSQLSRAMPEKLGGGGGCQDPRGQEARKQRDQ